MFQLPEDLGSLSVAELKGLLKAFRAEAAELIKASPSKTGEIMSARDDARKKVTEALAAAEALTALDAEGDDEDEAAEEPEEEPEVDETEAAATEPEEAEPEAAAEDEGDKPALAAKPRKAPAARGAQGAPAASPSTKRVGLDIFKATDRAPTKPMGAGFESWTELAQNLRDFAAGLSATSDQRFPIATARGNFAPAQQLADSPLDNLRLFDDPWRPMEEITAAICGPLPAVYDLACQNATNRPVKASLPTYAAPRGGVQIMQSPSLEDINGGYDIWDRNDDVNPAATKTCATVKCTSTNSYYIYAVWRCLTVQNMTAMTFPELVEAYLNRLAALQARLAETTLLEAMAADTTTITAHELGYNATTSIMTNLLNYLALYREQQRWDDQPFDAWMPRWIVPALKADLMRRKRTDGALASVPSDAAVAAVFSDVGVTPHFFRDTPSWATPVPKLQTSGVLGWFPGNLEMLVAPRGKFAVMDRGDLNIGVAGNIMRDNTSLSKNNFTFFFENFEGVVDTTSCPAHILQLDNLCFNGVQIADVVINCQGGDQRGAAS